MGRGWGFYGRGDSFAGMVDSDRNMWVEFRKASNLMAAEMWKEVLEGEGLPARILPEGDILDWSERGAFRVCVPKGREHVAEEILRKL